MKASPLSQQPLAFMQFMVDCAVILHHGVVSGVSQRNVRVQKYRGTSFDENEAAFLIGNRGIEVSLARQWTYTCGTTAPFGSARRC